MCLKHIFCLKHNQLLSNFWNTTSRFDSQAIGCITRISNRSRSDCFAIGKTWTKIHKMTNDRRPITIVHQLRMLPLLIEKWRQHQKSASASTSTMQVDWRLHLLTTHQCACCVHDRPVQHLCSTALCWCWVHPLDQTNKNKWLPMITRWGIVMSGTWGENAQNP